MLKQSSFLQSIAATFQPALRLSIGLNSVCLLQSDAATKSGSNRIIAEQSSDSSDNFQTSAQQFELALARLLQTVAKQLTLAQRSISVVLSDELVRYWQIDPPAGLSRIDDLHAAAALRFQTMYGENLTGWKITADWSASQKFFAAAIPETLLTVLEAQAKLHQLTVVSMVPQTMLAWNQWRHQMLQEAWFGVVHENILSIAAIEDGRIAGLRSVLLPHKADQRWLDAYLEHSALLLNLSPARILQFCGADLFENQRNSVAQSSHVRCIRLDSATTSATQTQRKQRQITRAVQLDFASPGLRRSLWQTSVFSYLAGAAGLVVCLSLLLQLSLQHLASQRQERQNALLLVQQRALKKPEAQINLPVILPAQAKAINQILGKLNLPWRDLQGALSAANSNSVALLSIEPDVKARNLKIMAETKNSDDMFAYLEALKQQEFFTQVILSKHEVNDLDPNKPLRFQLEVEWLAAEVKP